MEKVQAVNILINLSNMALKNGVLTNINDAMAIHTALATLAPEVQVEAPIMEEAPVEEVPAEETEADK